MNNTPFIQVTLPVILSIFLATSWGNIEFKIDKIESRMDKLENKLDRVLSELASLKSDLKKT